MPRSASNTHTMLFRGNVYLRKVEAVSTDHIRGKCIHILATDLRNNPSGNITPIQNRLQVVYFTAYPGTLRFLQDIRVNLDIKQWVHCTGSAFCDTTGHLISIHIITILQSTAANIIHIPPITFSLWGEINSSNLTTLSINTQQYQRFPGEVGSATIRISIPAPLLSRRIRPHHLGSNGFFLAFYHGDGTYSSEAFELSGPNTGRANRASEDDLAILNAVDLTHLSDVTIPQTSSQDSSPTNILETLDLSGPSIQEVPDGSSPSNIGGSSSNIGSPVTSTTLELPGQASSSNTGRASISSILEPPNEVSASNVGRPATRQRGTGNKRERPTGSRHENDKSLDDKRSKQK